MLVDACDRHGVAPQLDCIAFYQNAHRGLSAGGVFVANLCGEWKSCVSHLDKIAQVFGDNLLALHVRATRNLIVFAFKEPRECFDWADLETKALALKPRLRMDLRKYVRRMALASKLRTWQKAIDLSERRI